MNSFLIALQFLTRIFLVKQSVWTEQSFGASVKFFPAVGTMNFCTSGALPIIVRHKLEDCR